MLALQLNAKTRDESHDEDEHDPEIAQFKAKLRTALEDSVCAPITYSEKHLHTIVRDVCCPNKGLSHDNNKTYLDVRVDKRIHKDKYCALPCPSMYTCADSACGGLRWPGPFYGALLHEM